MIKTYFTNSLATELSEKMQLGCPVVMAGDHEKAMTDKDAEIKKLQDALQYIAKCSYVGLCPCRQTAEESLNGEGMMTEEKSKDLQCMYDQAQETIAGLETEIFRLQGMISLMYHFHDVLLRNIETNTYNMRDAMGKFIPRQE